MRARLPLLFLSLLGCGVLAAPASAITGGGPASEPYPWMVSLQSQEDHFCGGSLVRPDWVLTAAHCPEGEKVEDLSVLLGQHQLSGTGGERIAVAEVVIHEKYASDDAGGHDVALLRVERPSAAENVRIVDVSESALWAAGKPARVIGWGSSVFLVGPGSDDLMEVDVPMVSDEQCDTSYNQMSPYIFDPETMVCAGEDTGLKDSCQGDSGGPLVVKDAAGKWAQVGTVSFGLGCGFPIYYGVYGRIGGPVLNDWLKAHLPAPGSPAGTPSPAQSTTSGTVGTPATASPTVRVSFARKLGSARKARRRGVLRLAVASNGRVDGLRVTVTRKGKVVARGRLPRLEGKGVVLLPARALRAGRVRVKLTGTDAAGRGVTRSGTARLRR
jgi:secreted trypsin-like serine protease